MPSTRRNSLLCPQCRKLVSADEPRCPYCGTARPGAWWKQLALFHQPYQVVKAVIVVNVIMYVLALLLFPRHVNLTLNPLLFLSPSDKSLFLLGATGTIPIDRYGEWWTLISANYLHAGILHITLNMAAFYQLALLTIREYGISRMFIIYTLGGIVGFLISYLARVPFTIGASAAIFGLVGAILYYGKSRGGVYGRAILRQVGGWVVFLFVFGMLVPGINNWGHAGGLVSGGLLGYLLGYHEKKRESSFQKTLALICMLITVLVLGWAAMSTITYRFFV
jgi:membrane associated rhomboid family serine protease